MNEHQGNVRRLYIVLTSTPEVFRAASSLYAMEAKPNMNFIFSFMRATRPSRLKRTSLDPSYDVW
jgi:hypothetical protein